MSREDAIKLLKGAGIAAVGAVLTYLTQWISGHDFGSYSPMVAAGWAVIANAIRKLVMPTSAA